MDTTKWINQIIEKLEGKLLEINPGDFRFYNISHLPLLAKKTVEFHQNCSICSSHLKIIDQLVDDLPQVLTENARNRRQFEKKKNEIEKHLRKKHACRFPGYYAAMGALLGVLFGCFFAGIFVVFFNFPAINKLSLMTFALLLIGGKFIGDYIDKRVFKRNLQL